MPIQRPNANIALGIQPRQREDIVSKAMNLKNLAQQSRINELNIGRAERQDQADATTLKRAEAVDEVLRGGLGQQETYQALQRIDPTAAQAWQDRMATKQTQGVADLKLIANWASGMDSLDQPTRKRQAQLLAAGFRSSGNDRLAEMLDGYEWNDDDVAAMSRLVLDAQKQADANKPISLPGPARLVTPGGEELIGPVPKEPKPLSQYTDAEGIRQQPFQSPGGGVTQTALGRVAPKDKSLEEEFTANMLAEAGRGKKLNVAEQNNVRRKARREWTDLSKNPELSELVVRLRNNELSMQQFNQVVRLQSQVQGGQVYADTQDVAQGLAGVEAAYKESQTAERPGVSDLAMINNYQRIIDPGATVRSEDVNLILERATALFDRLSPKFKLKQWAKGDVLPQPTRDAIRDMSRELYGAFRTSVNAKMETMYGRLAGQAGSNLKEIGAIFPAIGGQGQAMSMADVEATARSSGKSIEEVIAAAKAKGYSVEP